MKNHTPPEAGRQWFSSRLHFFTGRYIHCYPYRMTASTQDDSLNWTDIIIIAAPSKGNVLVLWKLVVRWIDINPARPRTVERKPGMRRVRADKTLLARRRLSQQIAADITCR